jgi:hypothetical protein
MDITSRIQSLQVTKSVDPIDASASVVISSDGIAYTGDYDDDIAIDKVLEVSLGYESGGDELALQVTGQISSISDQSDAGAFNQELSISALSLFKNFTKFPVSTGWLEDMTGKELLDMIVGEFMGWSKYDFSACSGKVFARVRIDEMMIPDAIVKIAEACLCEVYFEGDGKIVAVAFPDLQEEADWDYGAIDVADYKVGDQYDIGMVNTLEIVGKEIDPDDEETPTTLVAERTLSWADSAIRKEPAYDPVLEKWIMFGILNLELFRSPVLRPQLDIEDDMPGTATYEIYGYTDSSVIIRIRRNPDDELEFPDYGYPDYTITAQVYGYLYQDDKYSKIRATVRNDDLLTRYNNIVRKEEYENPFIQTIEDLQSIGHFLIMKAFYATSPVSFTLPHNPSLKLNEIITATVVKDGEEVEYAGLVRTVNTAFNAGDYSLVDTVECWLIHNIGLG